MVGWVASLLLFPIVSLAFDWTTEDGIFLGWRRIYGLTNDFKVPPRNSNVSKWEIDSCFGPVHLQDCPSLTNNRAISESMKFGQYPPRWAVSDPPQPPWVSGTNPSNLPGTRRVQTDIWLHQFPRNCSSKKFLIMSFPTNVSAHGVGSNLHLMSIKLSLAMEHGRILILDPGTFELAKHNGCTGASYASFECYGFPITREECTSTALKQYVSSKQQNIKNRRSLLGLLASNTSVVYIGGSEHSYPGTRGAAAAKLWKTSLILPWKMWRKMGIEKFGKPVKLRGRDLMINWWQAQAVRFFLRYPSLHLCHISNRVRHTAFGRAVAQQQLRSCHRLRSLQNATIPQLPYPSMENADTPPYIPRPMLSMHVRQGDKVLESRTFSLAVHLLMAARISLHEPQLRNIWLSSETQAVVSEAREEQKTGPWRFFYSRTVRQSGNSSWFSPESLERIIDFSFADLLVSSEADYFVGNLRSNFARVINELRLTNGRLNSGYLTLLTHHHQQ